MAVSWRIDKNSWNWRNGHSDARKLLINLISSSFLPCGSALQELIEKRCTASQPIPQPSSASLNAEHQQYGRAGGMQCYDDTTTVGEATSLSLYIIVEFTKDIYRHPLFWLFLFFIERVSRAWHSRGLSRVTFTKTYFLSLLLYRWGLAKWGNPSRITQPVNGD